MLIPKALTYRSPFIQMLTRIVSQYQASSVRSIFSFQVKYILVMADIYGIGASYPVKYPYRFRIFGRILFLLYILKKSMRHSHISPLILSWMNSYRCTGACLPLLAFPGPYPYLSPQVTHKYISGEADFSWIRSAPFFLPDLVEFRGFYAFP